MIHFMRLWSKSVNCAYSDVQKYICHLNYNIPYDMTCLHKTKGTKFTHQQITKTMM